METSINILTTKVFIGYPLDLAQRVGEVGIASACWRQAFVRSALVAQAGVVWQGTGRVDLGSWFRAIQEALVAFHASIRGLGFVLWTSALPYFVPKVKSSASRLLNTSKLHHSGKIKQFYLGETWPNTPFFPS